MESETKFTKILDKGLITLPKPWRRALKLDKGAVLQLKKTNNTITIKPAFLATSTAQVPYRIYTKAELNQFLQDDTLDD